LSLQASISGNPRTSSSALRIVRIFKALDSIISTALSRVFKPSLLRPPRLLLDQRIRYDPP
jgi:hypothetical protein